MASLADLKSRIADDLARTDLTTQIGNEIQSAIDHHADERFWFNETQSHTFSTVAGTYDYSIAASSTVSDFVKLDWLRIVVSGRSYDLDRGDPENIDLLISDSSSTRNQPTDFAYYNRTIRLYPIPDAAYTITIAGHYIVPTAVSDATSNIWTTEAFELIRAAAKARLFAHVIKDFSQAQAMASIEDTILQRLRRATTRRVGTGNIQPTQF